MPLSLHDAIIPNWLQQLQATQRLLSKAQEWAESQSIGERELLTARLAEDMLPLAYQIKSCREHTSGSLAKCREGVFSPAMDPPPLSYAELDAKLANAIAEVESIDPAELEAMADRDMAFVMGDTRIEFTVQDFLLSFSTPNLYFHAATAYDILRMKGMPIGKRDFMGRLRIKRG
ncbi:DUF1993 domain-containing protein [Tsuneonella sp. HG249]